jgi:predicted DNA-binding transcriptional regulator YafY
MGKIQFPEKMMPRRPDALETVLLCMELLRRIPRNRKITATELQEQLRNVGFERELRTIQRQLDSLSGYFEIERDDRSKPYGYRWLEQAKGFAVPSLTPQESLLLRLAEEYLNNLLPASLMKSMRGFFEQARRNLVQDGSGKLEREWLDKVRVVSASQPLLPPRINPDVFGAVSEALFRNHWLRLDYRNSAGKRGEIEVMPLGLAQQGPCLYLVARYRNYDNERILALHRIRAARVSDFTFKHPREFNLRKYDADGKFGFGEGVRIRLTFCIDRHAGAHLLETPLSADQTVREADDETLEITATVVDSAMLEWWLRGFGENVWAVRRLDLEDGAKEKDGR